MNINKELQITPDMQVKIIEWMSEGSTPVIVAARLGMSKERLGKLSKRPENEDLRESIELGLTYFEAYMEKLGLTNINNKTFKEGTWKSFMTKYFDWNEKKEVKNTHDFINQLSPEELDQMLEENKLD